VLTEADPLDPNPPAALRPVVEGLLYASWRQGFAQGLG
jgi:hypothetical protein